VVFALKQKLRTVVISHTAVCMSTMLQVIFTLLNLQIISDLKALYHSF